MADQQPESFKFRLDPVSAYQIDTLVAQLGLTRSAVMRLALRHYAESRGIGAPKDLETQGKAAA